MENKQVLIVNLFDKSTFKDSFDHRITEVFEPLAVSYHTVYLDNINQITQCEEYTHLLISGSTESATEENFWYSDLSRIINLFIAAEKSLLGICFGHQFIIRHLLGKSHVRKSTTPEIGWTDITLGDNPLFHNIGVFKAGVYHYDEVFDLDEQFDVIAHSARCAIHAFQVKGKNIWGIQFHPDFIYQDIFIFADNARKKDPLANNYFCNTPVSLDEFRKNDRIFQNWLAV